MNQNQSLMSKYNILTLVIFVSLNLLFISSSFSTVFAEEGVIATIEVGNVPVGVVVTPDGSTAYVTNLLDDTVSVIGSITPTADAGPDQTVDSGSTVQLDGSGSSDPNNSPLTYQWTQTSGPPITLNDPTSVNPTFTAPDVQSQEEDIVFQLVVTNEEEVESKPDSVTITVNPVIPPTPPEPPVEGILGSGNNINIQVQENTGNNALGQSSSDGSSNSYSDESMFQEQSTEQDSSVIS